MTNTNNFKHGNYGYRYHKCRCDICKTANTERIKKYREKKKNNPEPNKEKKIKHGLCGYNYHKCRCDICKKARRENNKLYREKNKTANNNLQSDQTTVKVKKSSIKKERNLKHGIATYNRYKCRCDICTEAYRQYKKNYNLKRKESNSTHGRSGYNFGCRCEICVNANEQVNKLRREKYNAKNPRKKPHHFKIDDIKITQELIVPTIKNYSIYETFIIGDKISHPKFGEGTVLEVIENKKCTVSFEEGFKILVMSCNPPITKQLVT